MLQVHCSQTFSYRLKMFVSDLNHTPASTDTDPHPEFMIPKSPDSQEEDDIKVKVSMPGTEARQEVVLITYLNLN